MITRTTFIVLAIITLMWAGIAFLLRVAFWVPFLIIGFDMTLTSLFIKYEDHFPRGFVTPITEEESREAMQQRLRRTSYLTVVVWLGFALTLGLLILLAIRER